MRISDLLSMIKATGEIATRRGSSALSLALLKESFPRRDLIDWHERNYPALKDEDFLYIVGLVRSAARQLLPDGFWEVFASGDSKIHELVLPSETRVKGIDPGSDILWTLDTDDFKEHDVGLIFAVLEKESDVEFAVSTLSVGAPHAMRILFVHGLLWHKLQNAQIDMVLQGFEIFNSHLLTFNGCDWSVVYRSNRSGL